MTDRRKGIIFWPLKAVLYLASLLYGLALIARAALYKYGIFESQSVPMKIISVGNITLGGTGKTPFVIRMVRILKEELAKDPAVLIRGYGWDETAMLKAKLPETPILAGENRVKSAHRAIKLYGSDTAVLDDGFQHWELKRDLNIVLADARNPFGNSFLFPRGVLREGKMALRRADIVVLMKVRSPAANVAAVKREVLNINPDIDFMEASHDPGYVYDIKKKEPIELSSIRGKRMILLSSIGDPEYFENMAAGLGVEVIEHIEFPDHHNYNESDRAYINKRCEERSFDMILTTEKDAVKLGRMNMSFGGYTVMVLAIDITIISGKEKLVDRLHSLYTR
jgi:tetraacyldisaccharide 4'-kinase